MVGANTFCEAGKGEREGKAVLVRPQAGSLSASPQGDADSDPEGGVGVR